MPLNLLKAIEKLEENGNGSAPKEKRTKVKKTSYISHPAYIDEDTYAKADTALTEEGKKKITIFSKVPVEVNVVLTNAEGYPIEPIEEMAA